MFLREGLPQYVVPQSQFGEFLYGTFGYSHGACYSNIVVVNVVIGICQIQFVENSLVFRVPFWLDRSVSEGFVLLIHDAENCLVDVGGPCGIIQ